MKKILKSIFLTNNEKKTSTHHTEWLMYLITRAWRDTDSGCKANREWNIDKPTTDFLTLTGRKQEETFLMIEITLMLIFLTALSNGLSRTAENIQFLINPNFWLNWMILGGKYYIKQLSNIDTRCNVLNNKIKF